MPVLLKKTKKPVHPVHPVHTVHTVHAVHPVHAVHTVHAVHAIHTGHTVHKVHTVHTVICFFFSIIRALGLNTSILYRVNKNVRVHDNNTILNNELIISYYLKINMRFNGS